MDICALRPSDSWSSTEVRSLQHTHMWTIKGFSQCECRYLETSVKIKDAHSNGPLNDSTLASPLTFRIRLHPQGNKESNKDFCFFQVFSCTNVTKFKAKFAVYNTRGEEVPATVYTGTQQLNGYFEYIRRDLLISHIQPQDEIQLMLSLTIVSDTVTKSSQSTANTTLPEPRPSELAYDFETIFKEGRENFTDFKITCRGEKDSKAIKVHRVVLAARSPVFSAMLESHTEEAQNGEVIYEDIDYDVMRAMLFFMYSGNSPDLQTMALDLLAVSDRFQLVGLKEMAAQVLRSGLTVENVCRNLVLADMHNADELKNDSIRFIAQYSNSVIETEGWTSMVKEHPRLVTDIVGAMSQEQSRLSSIGPEPSAKRTRFDC